MPSNAVGYTLTLAGTPAGSEFLEAVQDIQVEEHAALADMLRLRVSMAVKENGARWSILDDAVFPRLSTVALSASVGSGPAQPLINGYVIESSATFANEPGKSILTVVAMDPTLLMNLEEKVRAWPNMADGDIATHIFGEYGFTAVVDSTQPVRQDTGYTTMQRDTDIRFLRHLARRNGFECYVEINPASGATEGHFHASRLQAPPQGVLTINMDQGTNVNNFHVRYDMVRPTTAQVTGLDVASHANQPASIQQSALPVLGHDATLSSDHPRKLLLNPMGLAETGELQTYAQAVVDRSAWAIVAEGDLNTVAFGKILRAKRPVLVRGAGRQFSGAYYVERVLHTFTADGYTQRFTLRRNAVGQTGNEQFNLDASAHS